MEEQGGSWEKGRGTLGIQGERRGILLLRDEYGGQTKGRGRGSTSDRGRKGFGGVGTEEGRRLKVVQGEYESLDVEKDSWVSCLTLTSQTLGLQPS